MRESFRRYLLVLATSTLLLTGCNTTVQPALTDDSSIVVEETEPTETVAETVTETIGYSKKLILAECLVGTSAQSEIQALIDEIEPQLTTFPEESITIGYMGYEYNDDTGLCMMAAVMNGYDVSVQNIVGKITITTQDEQEIGSMDIELTAEDIGVINPQQARVFNLTLPTTSITDIDLAKKVSDEQTPLNIYFTYECESLETEETEPTDTVAETIDYSKKLIMAEGIVGTIAQPIIQEYVDAIEPLLPDILEEGITIDCMSDYVYSDDYGFFMAAVASNGYDVPVQNILGKITIKTQDKQEIGSMDIELTSEFLGVINPKQSRLFLLTVPKTSITDMDLAKKVSEEQEPLIIDFTYTYEEATTEENVETTKSN